MSPRSAQVVPDNTPVDNALIDLRDQPDTRRVFRFAVPLISLTTFTAIMAEFRNRRVVPIIMNDEPTFEQMLEQLERTIEALAERYPSTHV
jgi:hypothetical protein